MAKPELVEKSCKCGCGKTWKALGSSQTEYYSEQHDPKIIREQKNGAFMRKMSSKKVLVDPVEDFFLERDSQCQDELPESSEELESS